MFRFAGKLFAYGTLAVRGVKRAHCRLFASESLRQVWLNSVDAQNPAVGGWSTSIQIILTYPNCCVLWTLFISFNQNLNKFHMFRGQRRVILEVHEGRSKIRPCRREGASVPFVCSKAIGEFCDAGSPGQFSRCPGFMGL